MELRENAQRLDCHIGGRGILDRKKGDEVLA